MFPHGFSSTLPTARDVLRAYPLRAGTTRMKAFSLDIKSAHKRIPVLPAHRGLLGFQFASQLFFYNVCPFGAAFSAHFWSRLGGFFLRLFHSLTWLAHAGFLYVDDLFMFQDEKVLPISAAMIVILCQICAIPGIVFTTFKFRDQNCNLKVETFRILNDISL